MNKKEKRKWKNVRKDE